MSRNVGLSANTSQFTLEGEPFCILGGSIHYFRVPRAYWRDRLMKMKACGINTLTTYVYNTLVVLQCKSFHQLNVHVSILADMCHGVCISQREESSTLTHSWT